MSAMLCGRSEPLPGVQACSCHKVVVLQLLLPLLLTLGLPNLSVKIVTRFTVPQLANICCSSSGVVP